MASNEFTDEFLNEVASNYHTVAEASRDLEIPYAKLRNALIKNGNLIPKVRHSLPDKMEFIKISFEGGDEFFIRITSNQNSVPYEAIEDAVLSYIDKYDPDTTDFIDIVMNSFEGLVWQYIEPSYTIVV